MGWRIIRPAIITVLLCGLSLSFLPHGWAASPTHIAVATNFRTTATALKKAYNANNQANITLTAGSTGKLYTQIMNGAPFALFLAADQIRPKLLIDNGYVPSNVQHTYALGKLALVSHTSINSDSLAQEQYRTLAIANPKLAPYGAAAIQALTHMALLAGVQDRIVMGENVGQAYALVATGNADLGLVASALIPKDAPLQSWQIPDQHYAPIRQDLVLLRPDNTVAHDFAEFILSEQGQQIIARAGYGLPQS